MSKTSINAFQIGNPDLTPDDSMNASLRLSDGSTTVHAPTQSSLPNKEITRYTPEIGAPVMRELLAGNTSRAAKECMIAAEKYKTAGMCKEAATCLELAGQMYNEAGMQKEAVKCYADAAELWKKLAEQMPNDQTSRLEVIKCLENESVCHDEAGKILDKILENPIGGANNVSKIAKEAAAHYGKSFSCAERVATYYATMGNMIGLCRYLEVMLMARSKGANSEKIYAGTLKNLEYWMELQRASSHRYDSAVYGAVLAGCFIKSGDIASAAGCYERVTKECDIEDLLLHYVSKAEKLYKEAGDTDRVVEKPKIDPRLWRDCDGKTSAIHFNGAIELCKKYWLPDVAKIIALDGAGKHEIQAKKRLEQSLLLYPDHVISAKNYERAKNLYKKADSADKVIEMATKEAEEYMECAHDGGMAYFSAVDYELAAKCFLEAGLPAKAREAYLLAAEHYKRSGYHEETNKMYALAKAIPNSSHIQDS